MYLKGIILALSLFLVMLVSAEAMPLKAEKILPSQVDEKTEFDLAKTYDGIVFSSSQVLNDSINFKKSAQELLKLSQIELKNGEIVYPEEIKVFISNVQKPPYESPAFKPPHE